MADTIEINGKTYTVPGEEDLTLGDMEIIQESFGGSPPDELDMRDVRMVKALVRITLEHAGESITDEEIRRLPMNLLNQAATNAEAEDDAVPPPVPVVGSPPSEPESEAGTPPSLEILRTASGTQ
jgi:hypothetical protein